MKNKYYLGKCKDLFNIQVSGVYTFPCDMIG